MRGVGDRDAVREAREASGRAGRRAVATLLGWTLALGGAVAGLAPAALAGGGGGAAPPAPVGLDWSSPQRALALGGGGVGWASGLVLDGGHEYWAYVDANSTPWLVTDASGAWRRFGTGITDLWQSNLGDRVGLAVHAGVAYIPYIPAAPGGGLGGLKLAYDPSGQPAGPWVDVTVVPPSNATCGVGGETGRPSAAVVGDTLAIAFDDLAPCNVAGDHHTTDVWVATAPLAALAAAGTIPWHLEAVTQGYAHSGYGPYVAADGPRLALAYQGGGGGSTLDFVEGRVVPGGAVAGPAQPQAVTTAASPFGHGMQLAAAGGVAAAALYAGGNVGDVWAATNGGGSWTASKLYSQSAEGGTRPSAAVGACGAAVAYAQVPDANAQSAQVMVAGYVGGSWLPVAVGPGEQSLDAQWPVLAATPTGFDLLYVNDDSGSPVLYAATATCPPPAAAGPVVAAVSPANGPAAGGTTVTITGSGFTGATQVIFAGSTALGNSGSGGPAAAFTVVSDSTITAVAPPGAGTVDVVVVTPSGGSAPSAADQFTYAVGPPCACGGQGSSFGDLGGYAWAQGAIDALAGQGIIKGTAPGVFDPAGHVTRAQFAALMKRLFTLPTPAQPIAFTDVPSGYWGYADVQAAAPYFDYFQVPGGGYAFHPDQSFDRQDVATVIVRLLVRAGKLQVLTAAKVQAQLAGVTDAAAIAPALAPYVATAMKAGILKGFPDGGFRPAGLLTRAQVAVVLQRLENSFVVVGGGK